MYQGRVREMDAVPHATSQHTAMDNVDQAVLPLRLLKTLSNHDTAMSFNGFQGCQSSGATKLRKRPSSIHTIVEITKCISKTAGKSFIICRNRRCTRALSNKNMQQHKH